MYKWERMITSPGDWIYMPERVERPSSEELIKAAQDSIDLAVVSLEKARKLSEELLELLLWP